MKRVAKWAIGLALDLLFGKPEKGVPYPPTSRAHGDSVCAMCGPTCLCGGKGSAGGWRF